MKSKEVMSVEKNSPSIEDVDNNEEKKENTTEDKIDRIDEIKNEVIEEWDMVRISLEKLGSDKALNGIDQISDKLDTTVYFINKLVDNESYEAAFACSTILSHLDELKNKFKKTTENIARHVYGNSKTSSETILKLEELLGEGDGKVQTTEEFSQFIKEIFKKKDVNPEDAELFMEFIQQKKSIIKKIDKIKTLIRRISKRK